MKRSLRVAVCAALGVGFLAIAGGVSAQMPIEGTWRLDLKESKDVPDQMKNVDLKITLKGKVLTTARVVDALQIGDPVVVTIGEPPSERKFSSTMKGTIEANWKDGGKALEQVIRSTLAGTVIPVVQKTLITVSSDGKRMTRTQTTLQAGVSSERVLVYTRR